MSDFALSKDLPNLLDHVMGGAGGLLVDQEEAIVHDFNSVQLAAR
jgi:hypothetical protein